LGMARIGGKKNLSFYKGPKKKPRVRKRPGFLLEDGRTSAILVKNKVIVEGNGGAVKKKKKDVKKKKKMGQKRAALLGGI